MTPERQKGNLVPGTIASTQSLRTDGYPDNHYEHFKLRREMIIHEDHQINHRVTVLLTTQSILFGATAVALTSSTRKPPSLNPVDHTTVLVWLLATVGISFGIVMWRAIWAGRQEQNLIKGDFAASWILFGLVMRRSSQVSSKPPTDNRLLSKDHRDEEKYHNNLNCCEALEICLQASGKTLPRGFTYSISLAAGSVLLWVALLALYSAQLL
jgi:hypothetical protein